MHPPESSLAVPPVSASSPIPADELELLADYLAREFAFDWQAASLGEVAWYRERIGSDICTLADAARLRSMTIWTCFRNGRGLRPAEPLSAATPAPKPAPEMRDEPELPWWASILLALVFFFSLIFLGEWWLRGHEPLPAPAETPASAPGAVR